MGATSSMRVPVVKSERGFVKVPANDDSIPHIRKFLDETKGSFDSREELKQFRALTSEEQRKTFIGNRIARPGSGSAVIKSSNHGKEVVAQA